MIKLYYDDWIAAAYMRREFGVRYHTAIYNGIEEDIIDDVDSMLDEYTTCYEDLPNLFVCKDSLDIFKPQVGDIVLFRGEFGAFVYADDLMKIPAVNASYCDPCFGFTNDVCSRDIIQRGGKPFFMPKIEE